MAFTGDKIVATATTTDTQDTAGGTSATSYTATLSGGTALSGTFVAPPSGVVLLHFSHAHFSSGAFDVKTAPEVRSGGVIGSGVIFLAAVDNNMVLDNGTVARAFGRSVSVTGLTPGSTYNVRILHKVSGGTGTWLNKQLQIVPQV